MNRIDRLTGTLLLLQSHSYLSLGTIATHWEVSERTVYRDLAALCEAGVPVTFEPELGYRLLSGYEVPPVMFSEDEALSLFLSGAISEQVADASLRANLRAALGKIRSVLPDERKSLLDGFKESLGIWFHAQTPANEMDCLLPLHHAALRRRCAALHYDTADRGVVTHREVEPLTVLFYAGRWHLIAYCRLRKDYRDFRMDRIRKWQVLEEAFQPHPDFSVDAFASQWNCSQSLHDVVIRVAAQEADRFRRSLRSNEFQCETIDDNSVRFRFRSGELQHLTPWLLSFGSSLTVEQPASLVQILRDIAMQILEQHSTAVSNTH
ncbi:MAG: YafY family protein [Puniceicoccaceae bacterium]